MSKEGERKYLSHLDQEGVSHAIHKPWSDEHCGKLLIQLGQVMELLPPPPAKLLDLGCGLGGVTSEPLVRHGYDVVGVDISEDAINLAKKIQRADLIKGSLDFQVMDYETTTFNNEFDLAVFFDSLHHAENIKAALRTSFQALREGGTCIISEPGFGHQHHPTSRFASSEYGVTEQSIIPIQLSRYCREIGFENVEIFPSLPLLSTVLARNKNDIHRKIPRLLFTLPGVRQIASLLVGGPYKYFEGVLRLTK